ncbi:MAG: biotin carboxylase [bacterium]|nr:biotin carboxylase [Deltaproteobacteria bacterium]MCP4907709.1 biotin carboxylase [bacterium]
MLNRKGENIRAHEAGSDWLRSFDMSNVKCLVVCRGPVRKEAFDVFDAIGVREYGMLLSEKDSVVYPRCLAPELRDLRFPANVHRVPDYMGVGQEEKLERIAEIIEIAETHLYTHIFAGYGFMAEDADFIGAIEASATVQFIGPSTGVIRRAGAKDEAKKLARALGNAVVPGIDNVSSLALVERTGDQKALEALARENDLEFAWDGDLDLQENAEVLLQAGYAKSIELVTIEELQKTAERESHTIWKQYPGKRIRYKCIGGGGGKGQRVVTDASETSAAVMDILAEQKVLEPGSNRNFLIELNLETTRHNEIQVIGNGDWSITLGGRDCSIQMREQKQLEFSLTDELLEVAAKETKNAAHAANLTKERDTLAAMERDGARFAKGVGLDNVSTFECIVEGFDHFFMEMNTRIQVEHGCSELAYKMRFTNPSDPTEFFEIERLIEAMVLLAIHGPRLPKPKRILRAVSGAEVRINAVNAALQPHAGGVIRGWSKPLSFEHRDDQGIGTRNPDTGSFPYYNLAGAYDSNIALVLCDGESRRDNLERLSEILRRMELRGEDLETSVPLHYGLVNWTLGIEPMMKPNTRFMVPYLAAVGALETLGRDVDLDRAALLLLERLPNKSARQAFAAQETFLKRPIGRLISDAHALAGFLGRFDGRLWQRKGEDIEFIENPILFLQELYHYLNMDPLPGKPASAMIWEHDDVLLKDAMRFYERAALAFGSEDWQEISTRFEGAPVAALVGDDADLWADCQAAHRGYQIGAPLLMIVPRLGVESELLDITLNDALEPVFPESFLDEERAETFRRALAPPPKASANEIVTPMGGSFYAREAPHLESLVNEGDHFEEGQPLFIIEVMKMFNKVLAPFSATLKKNLLADSDGAVVKAGQVIFEIEPDEMIVEESEAEITARRERVTLAMLGP